MVISVTNPRSGHDLSTADGVHAYLVESSPFSPSHVEVVTGGYGNWKFRVILDSSVIQDEALSRLLGERTLKTIIIKHSRDYAAGFHGVILDLKRVVRLHPY